jgi:hypothetical protein
VRDLLTPKHWHELTVSSAILPEIIAEEGLYSLRLGDPLPIPDAAFRHDNTNKGQRFPAWPWASMSGLVFPNWDHAGRPNYRIKPDPERRRTIIDEDGKVSEPRYEGCGGTRPSVYVPKGVRRWLQARSRDLWLVEGEKKTMAGVSAGLCIVGLTGVDCWTYKPDPADKTELGERGRVRSVPLPDWEHIPLRGRRVFLCFDSDVRTKREVEAARQRLAAFLRERGATVYLVSLPHAPDGSKMGLDDYIAAKLAAGGAA